MGAGSTWGKRRYRLEAPASHDWSPAEEEEKEEDDDDDDDEDGGAGGRDRRPSFALPAGAAIVALGPASRLPRGVSPVRSLVPAASAPVAPGAQPQMSSHNSRLAADSYKNCVWTISGEAPEFGAPVSCVRGSAWLLKSAGPGDLRSCASDYLADAQRSRPIPADCYHQFVCSHQTSGSYYSCLWSLAQCRPPHTTPITECPLLSAAGLNVNHLCLLEFLPRS
ncbi:uncharacterized protein LOC125083027 [Lutra lutra]|uniref:uncharacterized protein LOC125083027 n=1 Tax=Lutra lutra TaxID=9657 RepID=UPI001FD35559|nr:uncharacterized protein LOC125083027 [Lutra lutra]